MPNGDLSVYHRVDALLMEATGHIEDVADQVRTMPGDPLREAIESPMFRAYDEVVAAKRLLLTALVEVQEAAERYHWMREKWEDEHGC